MPGLSQVLYCSLLFLQRSVLGRLDDRFFSLDGVGLEVPSMGDLLAAKRFKHHASLEVEGGDPLRIAERGPRGIHALTNNYLRPSRAVPTRAAQYSGTY